MTGLDTEVLREALRAGNDPGGAVDVMLIMDRGQAAAQAPPGRRRRGHAVRASPAGGRWNGNRGPGELAAGARCSR